MDPNNEFQGLDPVSPDLMVHVVNQRKSERKENAERKRLENLRRINEMNSKTGIDPLELFPKEIWKKISELGSPDDRGNLCKLHPVFADLMRSTMIADILFHRILGLEVLIAELRSELKVTLVKLRSVCRGFQKAVDSMILDHLLKQIQQEVDHHSDVMSVSLRLERRGRSDEENALQLQRLDNFHQNAGNMPDMKLFLNSLSVWIRDTCPLETFTQFSDKILSLLEIVGEQLLYFEYYCHIRNFVNSPSEFPCGHCYILLQKCVSLMPNLNWLKVHQNWCNSENEKCALRAALNLHRFPRLENLEKITFEFFSCRNQEDIMYMAILEANPQVKVVTVVSSYWYDDRENEDEDERERRRPIQATQSLHSLNLTALAICNDNKFSSRAGENSLELVREMMNPNWPLTHLRMSVDMFNSSINELFRLLENFPTLEHLHLKTEFVQIPDQITSLRLPNLVEFHVVFEYAGITMEEGANLYSFFSLQFLLGSRNLKRVTWIYEIGYWNSENERFWELLCYNAPNHLRDGLLNCWKRGRDLKDSNIWNMFPCLEFVKVASQKPDGNWKDSVLKCEKPRF